MASLSTNTGNANADCSPASWAAALRVKFSSLWRSGIQDGSEVENTRPGRPSPGSISFSLEAAMKVPSDSSAAEIWVHRKTGWLGAYCQYAPSSQPRFMQIEAIIWARAESRSSAAANTLETAYCAFSSGRTFWD